MLFCIIKLAPEIKKIYLTVFGYFEALLRRQEGPDLGRDVSSKRQEVILYRKGWMERCDGCEICSRRKYNISFGLNNSCCELLLADRSVHHRNSWTELMWFILRIILSRNGVRTIQCADLFTCRISLTASSYNLIELCR